MDGTKIEKYSRESLELLQDGLNSLLDALISFSKSNPQSKTADVVAGVAAKDEMTWQRLKEVFDEGSLYEAFSADASVDPVQVLTSLLHSMDEHRNHLLERLKEWESKEGNMAAKVENLSDELETLQLEKVNLQHRNRLELSSLQSQGSTIKMLEEKLEQKDKQIAELQRSENVTLWQKEKDRLFAQHNARHAELEEKLKTQKEEYEEKLRKSEKRFEDLQNTSKVQKISAEKKQSSPITQEYANELKKKVYYLGKDLLRAEKEMLRMQCQISGVLQGVERDFRIVHHKMVDNKEVTMKHLDKLANWLNTLHVGFRDGDPMKPLSVLPDYYQAADEKKIKTIKFRMSAKGQLSGKALEVMVKGLEKEVHQIETDQTIEKMEASKQNGHEAPAVEHPQLIYSNGKVNTTALIKHFPALSVAFVQEQWANFKRYDRNGDGTLDLAEEVMAEVDDDQSSTLDFYEYLKVSVLIIQKTGKSLMLQDEEVTKNKKTLSKTCMIQ